MEVTLAHYEGCEVVQAQLDAQRNGVVVEGQSAATKGSGVRGCAMVSRTNEQSVHELGSLLEKALSAKHGHSEL
jgi:hypothetical protein